MTMTAGGFRRIRPELASIDYTTRYGATAIAERATDGGGLHTD